MANVSDRIEVWCGGNEWCPITSTAILLAKKWYPVIIHRLLTYGPSGFSELKNQVDGISSKVLAASLKDLQEKQLVSRRVLSEKPFRVEYSLTTHGDSLEPVITAMSKWGEEHLIRPSDTDSIVW